MIPDPSFPVKGLAHQTRCTLAVMKEVGGAGDDTRNQVRVKSTIMHDMIYELEYPQEVHSMGLHHAQPLRGIAIS